MKIKITANELIDKGLWGKYCEVEGTNPWAVNEGRMDGEELLTIDEDVANEIGLIAKEE